MDTKNYANTCLKKISNTNNVKYLNSMNSKACDDFSKQTFCYINVANTKSNDEVIRILKGFNSHWIQFCKMMNENQDKVVFDENYFLNFWSKKVNVDLLNYSAEKETV